MASRCWMLSSTRRIGSVRFTLGVFLAPLQVADPDNDRGQFMRIDVGLDAVKLRGANFAGQERWVGEDRRRRSAPLSTGPAAATAPYRESCRCRRPDRGCGRARALHPAEHFVFQLDAQFGASTAAGRLHGRGDLFGSGLDLLPATPQRGHQYRLQNQQNVFAAGVVRAKLGALAFVQNALEEGAEDGRLDASPIQLARHRGEYSYPQGSRSKTVSSSGRKRPPLKWWMLIGPKLSSPTAMARKRFLSLRTNLRGS
jgi:hypothetical protein